MDYFFEKVDNSKLVFFRIFFGLLMMVECWGAIATGWVKETFVDVQFTFHFIGFDWTQFLVGDTMYYVYGLMGFLGLLIMLGSMYRIAIVMFFILWALTYFMQKSHYNNHYYLILLVSFLMMFMPASKYLSIDAKMIPGFKAGETERWNYFVFKLLIACVYIFAAVAKLSPGWVDNHFLPIRLRYSAQWFENQFGENFFSTFLTHSQLAEYLAYAGIFFDFLIVPLFLFRPTRKIALILGFMFHLFNSVTLHIGIFPYFALAMCVFYFDSKTINQIFFPFKNVYKLEERNYSIFRKKLISWFVIGFVVIQVYLPIRHYLIPGDVLWTEEGHRMAWRMMLRSKAGKGNFVMIWPNGRAQTVDVSAYLSPNQIQNIYTKPDMIWQFAQKLKQIHHTENGDVQVYYKQGKIRINDGPYHDYIDSEVDLAQTPWHYFSHQNWILPEPADYYAQK